MNLEAQGATNKINLKKALFHNHSRYKIIHRIKN